MSLALVTAQPRIAATGALTTVRLAGGGQDRPYHYGGHHFRAGVARLPRFSARIGFDENGWTGGTAPTTGNLEFRPGEPALLDELARLFWPDAPITVETGPEGGPFTTRLTGVVADAAASGGAFVLTIADLSKRVDKPVLTARFAGTGGLEGGTEATGRIKRRSWGRVFNVEGRVLDKVNNIYEFGDPGIGWEAIVALRDKGREGPIVQLGWQGSALATLNALKAAAPPEGGGVVARLISCAKWWTQPAGPLTADIKGEIHTGYVETAPAIAERILQATGGPAVINVAAMALARPDAAGLHVAGESETAAQAIDRLLLGVSLLWILEPAGSVVMRELAFGASVANLRAASSSRLRQIAPVKTRRVGYQRAERTHGDGELAAILLASDAVYSDGTLVEALKPSESGATRGAPVGTGVAGKPAQEIVDEALLNAETMMKQALATFAEVGKTKALSYLGGEPVATAIVREASERIEGDTAIAETFELIGAKTANGLAFIIDTSKALVAPGETLAQRLTSLVATAGANATALVNTEAAARADADSALATTITSLTSTVGQNTSAIQTEATTRATADTALTTLITSLTSTVGRNTASIETITETRVSAGEAVARFLLEVNANGVVTSISATSDGEVASLAFQSDLFTIWRPGTDYSAPQPEDKLFEVDGTTIRMNDVEVDTIKIGAVGGVSLNTGALGEASLFFRDTAVTVTSTSSWVAIAAVPITPVFGKPIKVDFTAFMQCTTSSSSRLRLRVIRDDGTAIWGGAAGDEIRVNDEGDPLSIRVFDGSQVGRATTYTLQAKKSVNSENVQFRQRAASAEELSRLHFQGFDVVSSESGAGPTAGTGGGGSSYDPNQEIIP